MGATASVEPTGGHPLVVAELRAGEGLPTVTFYNHLDVEVRHDAGALPYRADVSGPLAAAVVRAMTSAFGRRPSFVRGGGTIGAVSSMERVLGCPVLFLDLSLPEHGYHAANEHFEWGQASRGIVAFARLLAELAGPDGAIAKTRREKVRRR